MDLLTIALLPSKTGPQEQEGVLWPHDHTGSKAKALQLKWGEMP